jgi:hypothetical protein
MAPTKADGTEENRKFKKSKTGRPYSTLPVARESFVTIPYRGLSLCSTLRPAVASSVCLLEDLRLGGFVRISEFQDRAQHFFKKMTIIA